MKKLIIFDMDGTLAESKSRIDAEMANLLYELLAIVKVAVISGGDWPQFSKQLLKHIPAHTRLKNLFILPTCGTKFYQYSGKWAKKYSEDFSPLQKDKIITALKLVMQNSAFKINKTWGKVIEDRGSQITLSALGQKAPLAAKTKWDPDFKKRKKMKVQLDKLLPGFSIALGGMTSVDVTKTGINKAYGIKKLRHSLHIPLKNMLFIGDAIFPGGNDYPAKQTGVATIQVKNVDATKQVIEVLIACLA